MAQFEAGRSGNPAGRPAGSKNKLNVALRELVLGALERAGGEDYLLKVAQTNPTAFLALVGKCLPSRAEGAVAQPPVSIVVRRPW